MPTIRKTTPGETYIHKHGTVAGGDTIDVDGDTADYLLDSGRYERVESDAQGNADETATPDTKLDGEAVDALKDGVCPWCEGDDGYEGDHVGQHASSAHPEKWDAYSEAV